MKDEILAGVPLDLDFAEMSVSDVEQFARTYGDFDVAHLEETTRQFQDAGCQWLLDFHVESQLMPDGTRQPAVPAFARLFSHPDRHFFAEVNQIMTPGAPPMSENILSLAGSDWSLETTSAPPYNGSAVTYALRRPHALWSRHPALSPRELIDLHLTRRSEIFDSLNLVAAPDVSAATYLAREKHVCTLRRGQAERVGELALMLDLLFSGDEPSWWGDYAEKFPERAAAFDNS